MPDKMIRISSILLMVLVFFAAILEISPVESFRLKLIHRDSEESPLYPGNLTSTERLNRLVEHSRKRLDYLESTISSNANSSAGTEQIRPPLRADIGQFVVQIGVGTPPITRFLVIDTGSALTWIQCLPCKNCYSQTVPIFDPTKSTTNVRVPCNHPLCEGYTCVDNSCHYKIEYEMPATSSGVLVSDTFTFESSSGPNPEVREHVVFGCSEETVGAYNLGDDVSGIMGLSPNVKSVLSQFQDSIGGRFSYCLPKYDEKVRQPTSFLRFGDDAGLPAEASILPFVPQTFDGHFYLNLIDISVADYRIGFLPGTFAIRYDNVGIFGGFVIDSGSTLTYFMKLVYDQVLFGFTLYFIKIDGLMKVHVPNLDMCYAIPPGGFNKYPTMTYHFEGNIDLVVQPKNLFFIAEDHFCLAMASSPRFSLLGAYQQQDYHFSFDLLNRRLSFLPADCSHGG